MHRQGHVGAALLAYAPIGAVLLAVEADQLALAGGAGTVLLAMLPDYDQRVPGLTHRGPTHTVWFALLVAVVLGGGGLIAAGPVAGVVAFPVGGVTMLSQRYSAEAHSFRGGRKRVSSVPQPPSIAGPPTPP